MKEEISVPEGEPEKSSTLTGDLHRAWKHQPQKYIKWYALHVKRSRKHPEKLRQVLKEIIMQGTRKVLLVPYRKAKEDLEQRGEQAG